MNDQIKQSNIQIFSSPRFYFFSAIIAGLLFAFMVLISKSYEATETILFSAKSQVAAEQQDKIISNMAALPRTLAFYDRMLKLNPDLKDMTAGKSAQERLVSWNNILQTRQVKENTSMISISISAQNENDAAKLTSKATRTLLDTMSFYYDIKKDVDFRIIDGPITTSYASFWQASLLISIILAVLISFLLEYFLQNRQDLLSDTKRETINFFKFPKSQKQSEEKPAENPSTEEEKKDQEKNETEKKQEQNEQEAAKAQGQQPEEIEVLNRIIEQETYPNYPEMPRHQTKASAPDNLPIADNSFFEHNDQYTRENVEEQEEKQEQQSAQEQPAEKKKNHEPSSEQLKKRLNQLLKGDL